MMWSRASMSADTPASRSAVLDLRFHFLRVTLCIAALANTLVPKVFFSEAHLFGQTDFHDRPVVAIFVVAVYAISFLVVLLHTNVGFAAGYVVATASIVMLGSIALA